MNYYHIKFLRKIRRHIKRGGIIAYPTEFCYGLGCDPFNTRAVANVIRLKARNKNKGLIIIAGDIAQLKRLILPLNNDDCSKIMDYWPGSNTLILPKHKNLVAYGLTGKNKKIALRVTKHQLVKQLCKFLGMPLVSTSANKSGHKPTFSYKECVKRFGNKVMVLPGRTMDAKRPSKIIELETNTILR